MTTIISVPDEMTSGAITASSGQSAEQKSKWLYELERAQWQAKQRPASFGRDLPKNADSETFCPTRPKQQVAKGTANNLESTLGTKQQIDLPSTNVHIQQPNNIGGAKATLPSSDQATTIPIAALVPIPLALDKTPANQITPLEGAPGAASTDRQWDKLRAHIEENDGEINFWLRDTRVNNAQGIQLAMALRKRFAEIGYRLACFTLNGRALPLDPPITISTHS